MTLKCHRLQHNDFLQVIMRMVLAIMWVSPVGIASVIAAKILAVDDIAV